MTPQVDTAVLRRAATAMSELKENVSGNVSAAGAALKKCSRMSGNDHHGKLFGEPYDLAAGGRVGGNGAIEVATLCGNAAGSLSELLAQAATNIDEADNQYGGGDEAVPPRPFLIRIPNLPKAVGDGGKRSQAWESIGSIMPGEWPNGDPEKLSDAAGAWSSQIQAPFDRHKAALTAHVNGLREQRHPEVGDLTSGYTKVQNHLGTVAGVAGKLSSATSEFGTKLGSSQKEIDRVVQALIDSATDSDFPGIGKWLARRIPLLNLAVAYNDYINAISAVQSEQASLISTALRLVGGFDKSAAGNMQSDLKPILDRWPVVADLVNERGEPLAHDHHRDLRRPSLREATKQAIQDQARKELIDGQWFFVNEEHPQIKTPVSQKYDDESIKNFPKVGYPGGPQDKFYRDPETGNWYPVNPRWEYGHEESAEWWRAREDAIRNNWTQAQVNDHQNDPEKYRIEDRYTNSSHRDEQPREGE